MERLFVAGLLLSFASVTMHGQVTQNSELPNAPSTVRVGAEQVQPASQPRSGSGSSSQEAWPRQIQTGDTTFTVYQPQLDSWDGNRIEGRSAVAVTTATSNRITYGVLWFFARTSVDKDKRMVTLKDLKIQRVRFPAAQGEESAYLKMIRKSVANKVRLLSLDRLEALVAIMGAEKNAATVTVKNDPPRIIFSKHPSLLVYIDGEPAYVPVKGASLQRVLNTRSLILRDTQGKYYLHLMDGWMEAPGISGPWTIARNISADLKQAEKDAVAGGQVDLLTGRQNPKQPGPSLAKVKPPEVYVLTSPTELIVTDGEPQFAQIPGTQLRYVENTTGHIFFDDAAKKVFVLISGRWFAADSYGGPWQYVPGGNLPNDFRNIPDNSPKENVKASIPGTPQAMEALIANAIPQTATVSRTAAKMAPPRFDGEPQWRLIEGTSLRYAINTSWPVVQVRPDLYYAVENAVWFKAANVNGPWTATDSVPAQIYSIPSSSPLHNITYVKIYQSTPETISVGYTNGYYGTCVSHGSEPIVVFGTGYRYQPWIGHVWYGGPLTYGYGSALTFTPWTGWTYGFGFGLSSPTSPGKAPVPESSLAASTTPSKSASSENTEDISSKEKSASDSGSSNVSVSFVFGAYPWWGPYGWGHYYPYPYYYPAYYYPAYGAAWGPYGASAWGVGGWAATTGNVYQRWGNTGAVTRTSRGYNAWTGDAWARQVGASYNSRTGTLAAGQRSYVANAYTGDYAYGRRGTAYNPNTGRTVTGGRYTYGEAGSDEFTSAGWARGSQGAVGRVGNDVYASQNGTVYRKTDSGWESNSGSGWSASDKPSVNRQSTAASQRDWTQQVSSQASSTRQSLDQQYSARQTGQQRTQNFNSGGFRSAGGRMGGGRRR